MLKNNGFNISVLASGSTGNATYIETPRTKLLVDAGLSGKRVEDLLKGIDREAKDLDAILVTHEHSDHIKGVGVLARRYDLPIYANEATWQAMEPKLGKLSDDQKMIFQKDRMKIFGDLDVASFGVSHDAIDPQFYTFCKDNKRFVILTDTGYVNDYMRGYLDNADAYLVEANHDVEMLRFGSYPWHLKQRILGDKGHLSNEDGGIAMSELVGDRTKRIYLGHLSQENNMKNVARQSVEEVLIARETGVNFDFHLFDTDPETPTDLYSL